jgi:site-specific recombinase XerD
MDPGQFREEAGGASGGLLDSDVDSFLAALRDAGYPERTVRKKRPAAAAFARWTRRRDLPTADINESHLEAFLVRPPQGARGEDRVSLERATVRRFLRHLRGEPASDASRPWLRVPCGSALEGRYVEYMRDRRGLSERTIAIHVSLVRDLVAWQAARSRIPAGEALDAASVRDFLAARIQDRSPACVQLLISVLRSFLRFLHASGETAIDLSPAVPLARTRKQTTVRDILSPADVERLVGTADPRTPRGRRNRAILLLLARLGLRAGEVVALELNDVRWRAGEIVVRGKGRLIDRLPLPSDVGAALAAYLRFDRGTSSSRRVFLRRIAPRVGLVGPAAVGGVVRDALARAGIQRTGRGAAHLLRHSLATRMIRDGASLVEIGEVLRHRSPASTEVYAQVAFEALREVARPWPGSGGGR